MRDAGCGMRWPRAHACGARSARDSSGVCLSVFPHSLREEKGELEVDKTKDKGKE